MFVAIAVIMAIGVITIIFIARSQDKRQAEPGSQALAPKKDLEILNTKNVIGLEAFTSRYVYRFGLVSMGSGYTIKVEDTESGSTIDATDYEGW